MIQVWSKKIIGKAGGGDVIYKIIFNSREMLVAMGEKHAAVGLKILIILGQSGLLGFLQFKILCKISEFIDGREHTASGSGSST
jgi:hypothetical protein